jgi:hypothetical protein
MPVECLYGWLGEKAKELDAPLGAAYTACTIVFGSQRKFVCNNVMPNLYALLLSPPHGGKTVVMRRAAQSIAIQEDIIKKSNLASDRGIYKLFNPVEKKKKDGEAEDTGLPKETKSHLLFSREFKDTMNKLNMSGSSLGPVLCDLWDDFEAGTADKFGAVSVNVCLNILGGLPVENTGDFSRHFGNNTSGGFYDRFIYAPIHKGWEWNHEWVPKSDVRYPKDPVRVPSYCYQMAKAWKNRGLYEDVDRDRLAEIALRLAVIWTAANHEAEVSKECMDCALLFTTWQERVRHFYSTGVAENIAAQCTTDIIKAFGECRGADDKTVHGNWRKLSRKHHWSERYGDLLLRQREALIKEKRLIPRATKDEKGEVTKDASWLRLNED